MTLGGTTVHTGLGFKFGSNYMDLSKENLDRLKIQLGDVEVVVIDEMSMISSDFLFNINQRMKDLFDSKDEFGGRALILAGDLLQLPPVNGTPIFKEPKGKKNKDYFSIESTESNPGGNLWQNCKVVYLKTNYRQGEGNPWTKLLNRVRIGEATKEDIELLKSRNSSLMSKEQSDKASHFYFRNKDVLNYNKKMLKTLPTRHYQNNVRYGIPKGSKYRPPINESKGTVGNSNFSEVVDVKIGARVMLVFNINIPDLLVNGALGTVVGIELDKKGEIECIVISFDIPDTGISQIHEFKQVAEKHADQNGCPIYIHTIEEFITTSRGKRSHGSTYQITQFPMRLAWASTAHKVQGVTIKKGSDVVTHGDQKMPDGMYYVMLSRAQDMENVYNENFLPSKLKANADALKEDHSLEQRCVSSSLKEMKFNFFVLNIRSFSKHAKDICQDIYAKNSDHICLVETWIDPNYQKNEDHQLLGRQFTEASLGKGKGCTIFSTPSKYSGHCGKVIDEKYQILSIVDGEIQLLLVYASKNCPFQKIVSDLENLERSDKQNIITGDFNFHRDEKNAFTEYIKKRNFVQVVSDPTHDGGRIIDHCYVPRDIEEKVHLIQHSSYYSDHDALCFNIDLK